MAVKEQKRSQKEYFSETVKEALEINRKAEELLERIFGEGLYLSRKDKELLEKEEEFLGKLKDMEAELKAMVLEEYALDSAIKARNAEVIRTMCTDLRNKISIIARELETLRNQEHVVEEKRKTEIKEIEEELKDTSSAEELIEELKALEERIVSLAEKTGTISKAKKSMKL